MTPPETKRAHIIVLGNEKGGSGKSTTAMHLIIAMLEQGRKVAAIDIDGRQRTLTRYMENRVRTIKNGLNLSLPAFTTIMRSEKQTTPEAQLDGRTRFITVLENYSKDHDIIVIDCPGSDSYLSRLAHGCADTLLTPINDSFIDLDLIAKVNPDDHCDITPNLYAELVWDMRKRRAMAGGVINWFIMRNRTSQLDARNKRRVSEVLIVLAKRLGFKVVAGFSERITYRELFLQGLTMLDLSHSSVNMTMSEVSARQEVRNLLNSLNLPPV